MHVQIAGASPHVLTWVLQAFDHHDKCFYFLGVCLQCQPPTTLSSLPSRALQRVCRTLDKQCCRTLQQLPGPSITWCGVSRSYDCGPPQRPQAPCLPICTVNQHALSKLLTMTSRTMSHLYYLANTDSIPMFCTLKDAVCVHHFLHHVSCMISFQH